MAKVNEKHPAWVEYLVNEILATCRDGHSRRFYTKVARVLPDEVLLRFLSEIRQDPSILNRGAVFTAKVKRYFRKHPQVAMMFPPRGGASSKGRGGA